MKFSLVFLAMSSLLITVSCGADESMRPVFEDYTLFEMVSLDNLYENGTPHFSHVHVEKLFDLEQTTSTSVQSIAVYGDELFSFHDTNDVIDIYDLKGFYHKESINLPPTKTTHCNNASFRRYSSATDSRYPFLYLMERGALHRMLVFKFVTSEEQLSVVKVQTIDLGTDTTAISYLDPDADKLYVHYYRKGEPEIRYLSRFAIPSIEEPAITLSIKDAEETVIMKRSEMQDATIYNGFLFMLQGFANSGQLHYDDLNEHSDFFLMDLPKYGLYAEPEGIAVYDNALIVSFYNRSVYRIAFYNELYSKVNTIPESFSSNHKYIVHKDNTTIILDNGQLFDSGGKCYRIE